MNEKTEWQQDDNNSDIRELMYIWNEFGISLEHHQYGNNYPLNHLDNATYGIVKGKIKIGFYMLNEVQQKA